MNKFLYAPGLPGFGTKGKDGSNGNTGLSMYFTNLNGEQDQVLLRTRIESNYILWSTSTPLPSGRTYQQGDLFVDSLGKVYYIDFTAVYRFTPTYTNFSMTSYFEDSLIDSDNGLSRYSNTFSDYLIDNVYSESVGEYTTKPVDIYSVQPKNFGRVEYVDVVNNTRNPFTVWIASDTCDNNAIALVRDTDNSNTFRIGNLNSNGKARNVNIKFDVDKLMVSKDTGKEFTRNTEDGTVITNHEINANNLVTPVFKYNPDSFKYESPSPGSYATIFWDKRDFLTTDDIGIVDDVNATLYFYEKLTKYKYATFNYLTIDASVREMSFHNIDVSGQLDVSALDSTKIYGAHIVFNDNGWLRTSIVKHIQPGIIPVLYIQDPCKGYMTTNYSGVVDLPGMSYYNQNKFKIDISTNISSGITVETNYLTAETDWITLSTTTPSGYPVPGIVDVSISSTATNSTQRAEIIYHSSAQDVSVIVVRKGKPVNVTFNVPTRISTSITESGGKIGDSLHGQYAEYWIEDKNSTLPTNTHLSLDISIGHQTDGFAVNSNAQFDHTIIVYDKLYNALCTFSDVASVLGQTISNIKTGNYTISDVISAHFPLKIRIYPYTYINSGESGDYFYMRAGFGDGVAYGNIVFTWLSGDSINITYNGVGGLEAIQSNY